MPSVGATPTRTSSGTGAGTAPQRESSPNSGPPGGSPPGGQVKDQHGSGPDSGEALIGALRDLYAYTYGVDPADVRQAAALRAEAMDVSDRWVAAGCDVDDPLLAQERGLLVRSYASLLAAVHR